MESPIFATLALVVETHRPPLSALKRLRRPSAVERRWSGDDGASSAFCYEAASPTSRATETTTANISQIVFDGAIGFKKQDTDVMKAQTTKGVVLEVYPNSPNATKTNDNEDVKFLTPESSFMVVELFAYDNVKKSLTPKHGEKSKA
ncbi:hypothetical protein R6Q59_028029 [Mikania micrantha]